jgi:hypothetical protein
MEPFTTPEKGVFFMPNYSFPSNHSDDIDLPRSQRRPKRDKPVFIKSEFAVPENYQEYRRAGIPVNASELVEEFLKQFPSHEELARWEAKGMEIAGQLNRQLYEIERICLRVEALNQNFDSLEEVEVLLSQLRDATSALSLLQAKLQAQMDDQLFPWLTKSNLKKNKYPALAFCVIVATVIMFVRHGSSTTTPSPTPTVQPSSSVAPAESNPNR